ncbi:Twin-arginine translocation pathway signal [Rhodoferax ferrireducens T118]|uniref:Twin-arginine translocation pathway signal n=1 Tax=Albidiferax ferrireducens (strain ATCC BAA-621 / DSM 15236 / T118) TaxID=338969 RepID=Q21TZ1_ALBFT|nr:twin-arginine translocation pathway signal protein [Rhodoferax ferrireducens]ABD70762.1 Twin-arginine translocation pathway signal [Rhodoferax ferrireducens T118]
MDRRYFLKGLGAGTVGLSLPPTASSAKSCKVIGIGGTGCNFVQAASQSGAIPASSQWVPEFIGVDLDLAVLNYIDADNAAMPGCAPIKTVSLATLGAAGRANRGRAAALRKRDALKAVLGDTEVVFLVAGLGGGTGSSVTPIMAKWAREAGVLTVAAAVTPFAFEGEARNRTADTAFNQLKREADLLVRFPNQTLNDITGDDIDQSEFFALQNQRIVACVRGWMEGANDATRT